MRNPRREELLKSLVTFAGDLATLRLDLDAYPWDAETALVALTAVEAKAALARFVAGEISPVQLSSWADLIEMRDDIFLDDPSGALREFIYVVATPETEGEFDVERALGWLARLTPQLGQGVS